MSETEPETSENEQYSYGERTEEYDQKKAFRPGEGRISGYISATLGILSLASVLCFIFPSYLTTPEFRESYDVDVLRWLLRAGWMTSVVFGLGTFVLNRRKRMGAVGLVCCGIAYLLGGWNVEIGDIRGNFALGVDWMVLDFLGSTILFVFIEKLWPKYADQPILRPEWRLDLWYFAFNHLAISVFLIAGHTFATRAFGWAQNDTLREGIQSLPIPVQVLLLMLAADLVQYWVHRTFHEVPALWRFHAVHHCTETMDWLAGSRNHIVQILVDRSLVTVPLFLLSAAKPAFDTYVVIAAFQAVFIHANVSWNFGPLRHIFATPQFHHWHHSRDKPAIDTNYAIHFAFLDKLFGSFHLPDDHWPKEYGTTKPLPSTFLGQLAYPFTRSESEESPGDAPAE